MLLPRLFLEKMGSMMLMNFKLRALLETIWKKEVSDILTAAYFKISSYTCSGVKRRGLFR